MCVCIYVYSTHIGTRIHAQANCRSNAWTLVRASFQAGTVGRTSTAAVQVCFAEVDPEFLPSPPLQQKKTCSMVNDGARDAKVYVT